MTNKTNTVPGEVDSETLRKVHGCVHEVEGGDGRCLQKFPWLAAGLAAAGVGAAAGSLIQDSAKKMQKSGPEDLKRQVKDYLAHEKDVRYLSPGLRDVIPSVVNQTERELRVKKTVKGFFEGE